MKGNRALLTNSVKKFHGMVQFGNDDFTMIAGYGDMVIVLMTIKKVYYVEGLGHNLFSVGQFCDKGLEVAFQKSSCFVQTKDGVDLLTGDHSLNLYIIALNDIASNLLDEASEVIISFIKKTHVNLQLQVQVQRIRMDNGTEFKNKTLAKCFDEITKSPTTNVETSNEEIPLSEEEVFHGISNLFQEDSTSSSLNDDVQQTSEEVVIPLNTQSVLNKIVPNVDEASTSHNMFNDRLEDASFDATEALKDDAWVSAMQEELDQFARLEV
ncbi:hypothetical protein Tco_0437746 [Tanacetum coccineum]